MGCWYSTCFISNLPIMPGDDIAIIVLAAIISVVSQFGDLVASYIKREREIKDFGFIFPGHGGVLDRFDSIIAVAPTIYFITYFTANSFPIFIC